MSESDIKFLSPYSSTFGFGDLRETSSPELEGPETAPDSSAPKQDLQNDLLRLMQLQRHQGPVDLVSAPVGGGPIEGEFTSFQRPTAPNQGDVNRLMLNAGVPIDENFRLGANLMAQQETSASGNTIARPSLNLGYGPVSLNAGYLARVPSAPNAPSQVSPSYGANVNLPVAGGNFSGGISKTAGERDPFIYAGYQYPLFGGTLGFELSSADRLRNLAALITGRWSF